VVLISPAGDRLLINLYNLGKPRKTRFADCERNAPS
jgi:hypothetical protein